MNEEALEEMINKTENSPNNTVFNDKYLRSTCSVSTSLLRWSVGDTHNDIKNLKRNKFDIIIAADCLFFEDFHDAFIWILKNCLEKNGFCFLLQPKRGKSMDNFMLKIRLSEDFLVVSVADNYNEEVRQLKIINSTFTFHFFLIS
jgi:predicted nicotinamide N-methyase